MFVELVDALRCVRPHEDAWLVAAARRTAHRHIVDGVLGCPVCRAEYPVRDAVADFRPDGAAGTAAGETTSAGGDVAEEEVLRAAALLALADVRGPVLLCGSWGALAPTLVEMVSAAYLVVNPITALPLRPELSALHAAGALPLATGAAHGAALDDAAAGDAGLVAGVVRALRGGGRLVAPVSLPLPAGVRELARDARHWVAEREAGVSAPVALRRASQG